MPPNINSRSIPTPNLANPTTPTAVLETAGQSFPDNASGTAMAAGASLKFITAQQAYVSLYSDPAGSTIPLGPSGTPGNQSITIITAPTGITSAGYASYAKGNLDLVVCTGGPGTPAGGVQNVMIGSNNLMSQGSAPNGTTSTVNTLIGTDTILQDWWSNNGALVGTNVTFNRAQNYAGIGDTLQFSSTVVPTGSQTCNAPCFIGQGLSAFLSIASATAAVTGSQITLIGSGHAVGGGVGGAADLITVIGANCQVNTAGTESSTSSTIVGTGVQDSTLSGVMRVGHAYLANEASGVEASIDFVPGSSVNNGLILIGTAKQNGANPLNGTASSRGTLTGGRGANAAFQFALADQGYTASAPTTGGTVTIPNGCTTHVLNPAGTLSTLTVNMPPNPIDGQYVTLTTTQTVTTLTMAGNGNTLTGGLTTITSTTPARWMFCKSGGTANAPSNTWVRHD